MNISGNVGYWFWSRRLFAFKNWKGMVSYVASTGSSHLIGFILYRLLDCYLCEMRDIVVCETFLLLYAKQNGCCE